MGKLLFSQLPHLGFRMVTQHVVRACEYFLNQISRLPELDIVKVRYEDLCQEPEQVADQIIDTLGLVKIKEPDYPSLIQPRKIELVPEIKRVQDRLTNKLSNYLEYWNYGVNYETTQ